MRRRSLWMLVAFVFVTAPGRSAVGLTAVAVEPRSALATSVERRIALDRHVVSGEIRVEETAGIVRLLGAVPVPLQRGRAANLAALVSGVRAVVNHLTIAPVARPDGVVTDDARRRLRETAALASLPIRLTVVNGVATLSGTITSLAEQQLAERVVVNVPGIRFCQNQLAFSAAIRRTDELIRDDIISRFDWDLWLQQRGISVAVQRGVAHLRGVVLSAGERRRAMRLASVSGVSQIVARRLTVRPVSSGLEWQGPTDAEVASTIMEIAPYWPSLDFTQVSISVARGVATLRGSVPTITQRQTAETVASSVVGVTKVVNELRGPWWRPPPSPPRRPPTRSAKRRGR